jgi:hypothetical protein
MNAKLPLHVLPRVDLVYAKTPAGRGEVAHRSAGLNARERAALIMLDGVQAATMLVKLMPADQVAPVLAALLAQGLIAAPVPAAPAQSAEATALGAIKADLIEAAQTHLGLMASEIVERVRQAADAAQLLRILGRWHMAMQESKHGREAASNLLEKTRATLQETALS